MKPTIDWRLYLIIDRALVPPEQSLEPIARAAAAGGATIFQLRNKSASAREMIADASLLRGITHELGLPLIINDRVDVALAVNADGVHLGPEDMSICVARRLLGPDKIIGASTGTVEEARQAMREGADYLGVGAIYHTQTKADAGEPIGLTGLQKIIQIAPIPVIGVGGLNAQNVQGVIQSGAAGAAIVSAIVTAPDVISASRFIRGQIEYGSQL